MILTFILSLLSRTARYTWAPALDLSDGTVRSALLPNTQY